MMKWIKFVIYSLLLVLLLLIGCALLPKPSLLQNISFSKAVYDENHHLLRLTLSADQKYRLFTPLNKVSPLAIKATLLQEDHCFEWHLGVNPVSLLKAAWKTYAIKKRRIGGSTITMQVVRMRFHINSRTVAGKSWQILRALELECLYSKNQILEAYFNLASYGENIEGIGAASLIYFNKSAERLNLSEALTLAIIPQNPLHKSFISSNLANVKMSRNQLFLQWLKRYPTDGNQAAFMALPLQSRLNLPCLAPHFVVNTLERANTQQQFSIVTTLNLQLQTILEATIARYIQQKSSMGIRNVAAMLVDVRNMEVKALVGSGGFFNASILGQINGTHIKRSPGSTLKPFIYALAFDQGLIHPYSILKDAPTDFGAYSPDNFDYDFMGPIKAKDALILSRNIPAIYLTSQLSHPDLYEFMQEANITHLKSEEHYGLSLTLGGAEVSMQELVGLYATLANGGLWKPLRYVVFDPISRGTRLLSPEACFLTLDILKDANRPAPFLNIADSRRAPVFWKTGTSSRYRDAWTIGIFGPYVLAVWVGDFNNKGNTPFIGKDIAAPLFFAINDAIETQVGPLSTLLLDPKKLHLAHVDVCEASGAFPTSFCPHVVKTWFIPGISPIKTDTVFREVMIDHKTGLRACKFDPLNTFSVYEFWPTDLLKIFQQAGLQPSSPPPFDVGCNLGNNSLAVKGNAPKIISPHKKLIYAISVTKHSTIPFIAIGDGDVKNFYWFVDQAYIGKSSPTHPLLWLAKPGDYVVRVADDYGRSDAIKVKVENAI